MKNLFLLKIIEEINNLTHTINPNNTKKLYKHYVDVDICIQLSLKLNNSYILIHYIVII